MGLKTEADRVIRREVPYISEDLADALAKWIVPANGSLCGILALVELWKGRSWSEGMTIGGGFVAGFVMAIVMWARRELRTVDMGELEKLKYRAKGT